MLNYLKPLDIRFKYLFLGIVISLFWTHGMALFNKFSFHDDAFHFFDVGATYTSGRWGLELLKKVVILFYGSNGKEIVYSIPIMGGVWSALYLSIFLYIIVLLFNIKDNLFIFLLGAIFMASPYFVSLFAFMFTSSYYVCGLLFSAVASYLIVKRFRWFHVVIGIILGILAISIYQANLSLILSIILLYYIKEFYEVKKFSLKEFWYRGGYYLLSLVLIVLGYLAITTFILRYLGLELTNYKDINKMGYSGFGDYVIRLSYVYTEFFSPTKMAVASNNQHSLFPLNTRFVYQLILGGFLFLVGYKIVDFSKKDILKARAFWGLSALFPLACLFCFFMCKYKDVHELMLFSHLLFLVFFVWLFENTKFYRLEYLRGIGYGLFGVLCLMYCRFGNIMYIKANVYQERMISYYTSLISEIKSTDMYKDEYPVVMINERNLTDKNFQNLSWLKNYIRPYFHSYKLLNDYAWRDFLNIWCGYKPEYLDASNFENLEVVKNMPHYPDKGAIKVVNETVIIKF